MSTQQAQSSQREAGRNSEPKWKLTGFADPASPHQATGNEYAENDDQAYAMIVTAFDRIPTLRSIAAWVAKEEGGYTFFGETRGKRNPQGDVMFDNGTKGGNVILPHPLPF